MALLESKNDEQLAARLQASEQRYASLVAAAPVGIFRTDAAGHCIYVNDRWCQIAGLTSEAAAGEGWRQGLHPDDRDRISTEWYQSAQENRPFQLEYRFQHPDGVVIWVYGQSVAERDSDGQVIGYVGTVTDINDRKRSEKALQQSEAHQRALISAIPDLITRVSRDGICLEFASAPNFDLVGGDPADFVGAHVSESLPTAAAQKRLAYMQRALETQSIQIYEQDLSTDDTTQIEEVRIVPYGEDEVLALVRDISDRKQAENRLRQSERRFRRAIADAPFPIMIHAEDGEVLQINAAWTELTGYTHSDIPTTQAWAQQAYGDGAASILENIIVNKYALTSRWDEGEFTITTRDGGQRIWQFSSAPLGPLPDSRRVVISMAADVTQHRQVETALRESEAQSRAVLAAIPDYLFRVGADGIYRGLVTHNRESDLLPADLDPVGLAMSDVLPADIAARHLHALEQALHTGELQVYEQRVKIRENLQDEEIRVMKSGDDEVLFMIRDISDRKRAEAQRLHAEQIRQELTILEQILDNILAGYWDWDIPDHSEYLSPGFKRMFGYEDHELPNTPDSWQNLIFPEDLTKVLSCFERHVQSRGKIPYCNEVRYRHKDGSTVWVNCSGQVIEWDAVGNPIRMIGCHIDMSDRKRAEEQIRRYAAQLEVSNQELEAFAYSVSHDLRAPLRAIDGFSKALLEDYGDSFDEAGKDYFDRIRKNVGRMGGLIDDLLKLSRVSRTEIRYTSVNLSAIAQELMADLQASEPERPVEVAISPDIVVSADATLMRVVISNLLQNAWKFTRHHPTARIEFGIIDRDEQIIYFVKDDGAGFDMAYSKMLFGVFQRLHGTHEFPGAGIGLATVQRAIHRHGGQVWAESAVEQGAAFYFTVPSTLIELGA
ncbi:MAG: PAS domain S-box protein [Cyanobacteria bacterium J06635_1]